jgi:F-type H+-transporting ATPase subunit delta
MKYTAKQYAKALMDALETRSPKDQDKILDNFVEVLARNSDLKLYDDISQEFHKLELKAKGITQANVTTAHPLGADAEKKLVKELNEFIKGKVEIKKKVDANLIGGVVVQLEDTLIDASVKRSLEDLKNNLET